MDSPLCPYKRAAGRRSDNHETAVFPSMSLRLGHRSGPIGIAATAFPAATKAACEILRAGGNAIDAAVAAAWALAVCEPANSGLGGQTVMLIRQANGETTVLDGGSRGPAAVSLCNVTRHQQRCGYRATSIPTTPLVLETARQRFGRLDLARLMEPAIRLAEDGFRVTPLYRRQLAWCHSSLSSSSSTARFFLKKLRPYGVGDLFRQPELATTLRRVAHHGAEDFYHGHLRSSDPHAIWKTMADCSRSTIFRILARRRSNHRSRRRIVPARS